jgi:hypothetical protein
MDRRTALKQTAWMLGGTIVGSELFLSGCGKKESGQFDFSDEQIALMDEIGETILPDSELSPGAKAAEIGLFMALMVRDCYSTDEQALFLQGLKEIQQLSDKTHNMDFISLSFQQKTSLLTILDLEASQAKEGNTHYYTMIKQLTLLGYFTSEIGITKALRYNPIPGLYDGCVPYDGKEPAWYGPSSSIG